MSDRDSASAAGEADLLSLRWLGEMCGLPAVSVFPRLASAMIAREDDAAKVVAHIAWWSRHPDPGGNFERAARDLPDMPDIEHVAALAALGYDGLIYQQGGAIVGHFFFQRHIAEMHAFAAWADEQHRGGKLMANAAMDFLAYASRSPGVLRARIGTGHAFAARLLSPLMPLCGQLGWHLRDGGWVDFTAARAEPVRNTN
jgi:hypothetical protein